MSEESVSRLPCAQAVETRRNIDVISNNNFFIKTSVGGVAGVSPAGWVGRNEVRPQGGAPPS